MIVTATVYNTDRPYSVACSDPDRAHIARYAWGDDYHDVLGARLDARVYGPTLMERAGVAAADKRRWTEPPLRGGMRAVGECKVQTR